jgi:hypothetical protein
LINGNGRIVCSYSFDSICVTRDVSTAFGKKNDEWQELWINDKKRLESKSLNFANSAEKISKWDDGLYILSFFDPTRPFGQRFKIHDTKHLLQMDFIAKYDFMFPFRDGRLVIRDENALYGIADRNGNIILPPTYAFIGEFSEGFALYRKDREDRKYYLLDTFGTPVFDEVLFRFTSSFHDGVCLVFDETKYNFMKKDGSLLFNDSVTFEPVGRFSEGLACVRTQINSQSNGDYFLGFVDKSGKYVIPPKYKVGGDFQFGRAFVRTTDDHKDLDCIDSSGRLQFRLKNVDHHSFYRGTLALFYIDGKYHYINKYGKVYWRENGSHEKETPQGLSWFLTL